MKELTNVQKQVLLYIINFKQTNGYSPSNSEIAYALNYSNISYINRIMHELKDKGYITFIEKKPRTIRVLKFIS